LGEKLLFLLQHDEAREAMGQEALSIIRENRGAARKSLSHVLAVLGSGSMKSHG